MHNMIYLIGRLQEDIVETTDKSGRPIADIKIEVRRNYKNENGEYDSDILTVRLWALLIGKAKEYCHKGDLIGIKGRIQYVDDELTIIADKITFLTSNSEVQ